MQAVVGALRGGISQISSVGRQQGQAYVKGLQSAKGQAQSLARSIANAVRSALNSQTGAIGQVGRRQGQQYVRGIQASRGSARSAGSSVAQAAKAGASSVGGWQGIGRQMTAGIASGVRSGAGILSGAIRSVVSGAVAAARAVAKIHSPSRLFASEVGEYFPSGMAMGVDRKAGAVKESVKNAIKNAVPKDMPNFSLQNLADRGRKLTRPKGLTLGASGITNNSSVINDNRQFTAVANGADGQGVELTPQFMKRLAKELAYYANTTERGAFN